MSKPARIATRLGGLIAAARLAAAGASPATAGPCVSLGDAYTAGPSVPNPTGSPILCGRSTDNYPSDVAHVIHASSFTDASRSSATSADMTQSQSLEGGLQTAPPQFNALKVSDARCKDHFNSGADDSNVAAINATVPKVAATIQGIHPRAPQAKVLVIGYPDGLPQDRSTCYPVVPLSSGDITYNSLELPLNGVIKRAAQANGTGYVDTFTTSLGHDARTGVNAWVNGIIPTSLAFPLHPDRAGEQNMANQVLADL